LDNPSPRPRSCPLPPPSHANARWGTVQTTPAHLPCMQKRDGGQFTQPQPTSTSTTTSLACKSDTADGSHNPSPPPPPPPPPTHATARRGTVRTTPAHLPRMQTQDGGLFRQPQPTSLASKHEPGGGSSACSTSTATSLTCKCEREGFYVNFSCI
jgi:hypothetical protein